MNREWFCCRCGEKIQHHIIMVRSRNQYDVCDLCADEIEAFIKTPVDRTTDNEREHEDQMKLNIN